MKFDYQGDDPGLRQAAAIANGLAADAAFWDDVAGAAGYAYTALPPAEICRRLQACPTPVRVLHWRPLNILKYRSTVAVTDPGRPFTILYHMRFIGNSVGEKVNTLVHEFIHNVDFFGDGSPALEYSHPGSPTDTRPDSAPYRIGTLAQRRWEAGDPTRKAAPLMDVGSFDGDIAEVRDDEIG